MPGWTYRDTVPRAAAGILLSDWLADRYRHSDGSLWQQRIAAGELDWNGALLTVDRALQGGETLCWRRPPWLEQAIPDQWETIHDDGDLLVINKPSGLPVMPGGGFFFQAEDGIRDVERSRGLGDVYKRQEQHDGVDRAIDNVGQHPGADQCCLLYTSDAADE